MLTHEGSDVERAIRLDVQLDGVFQKAVDVQRLQKLSQLLVLVEEAGADLVVGVGLSANELKLLVDGARAETCCGEW